MTDKRYRIHWLSGNGLEGKGYSLLVAADAKAYCKRMEKAT